MDLPLTPPIAPMLAKAVKSVPAPDSVAGGLVYEPKWDGFRCVVYRDGDEVVIGSRGEKELTRYFPEVVEAVREHLPPRCVVDGELVVRVGERGAQRLDWDALSQRIHPADSRVRRLAEETPAEVVVFDLLALDDESLMEVPFAQRRSRLVEVLGSLPAEAPVHLTRVTEDADLATRWLEEFEGAGLDGVVAKPLAASYQPGKRVMLKVKHARTAEVVVHGYRVHKSGHGVGSLLLSLYDDEGRLIPVGGASAFSDKRRLELVEEMEPYVVRDDDGQPLRGDSDRNRFSASKDTSYVLLRPEVVVEVRYDQMEAHRFRHAAQLERFRPDRDATSCTFDQIDRPLAYDLDEVLGA